MNGPLALRLYANAQNATPYYGFLINLRHKVQDRFYKHCSMTQLPEVGKISQSVLIFYFILFLFFFFHPVYWPTVIMTVKVFVTGATGYIGGDVLYHLHQKYPDFEYALLVRSDSKTKKVLSQYPKARIVIGGLDDSALLEREAAWADIVIREYTSFLSPDVQRY